MDFVTIGNPGNVADSTGLPNPAGSVPYVFRMGKYEVSESMVTKASILGGLGIEMQVTRGGNKPATYITWNEAARFVNWLNTDWGSVPAYKFTLNPGDVGYSANLNNIELWTAADPGFDAANPYRDSRAHFFLPSENEWYKAAYFDGTAGVYYNYPTGSDTPPSSTVGGASAGTAVFTPSSPPGPNEPADIMNAGGLSPYGTMGQGGNVREWVESAADGVNDSPSEDRPYRGGYWLGGVNLLESASRTYFGASDYERYSTGFRIAAVPEPLETAGVAGLAALGFALWRRRNGA
jgi:hypothetical protein